MKRWLGSGLGFIWWDGAGGCPVHCGADVARQSLHEFDLVVVIRSIWRISKKSRLPPLASGKKSKFPVGFSAVHDP